MKNKVSAVLTATIEDCFERGLLSRTPIPPYVIEIDIWIDLNIHPAAPAMDVHLRTLGKGVCERRAGHHE